MIIASLMKPFTPLPNVLDDDSIEEKISIDDDFTVKLQAKELPLEIQLMLIPMWTLRADYHDCMELLDKAMTSYRNSKTELQRVEEYLDLGIASNAELAAVFNKVMILLNAYERNQLELLQLLATGNHQLSFYSRATKNNRIYDEMMKLKDVDPVSFTQRSYAFEHVVMSLFKLVGSLRDSLKSSQEIQHCCATYLVRLTKHVNFPDLPRKVVQGGGF